MSKKRTAVRWFSRIGGMQVLDTYWGSQRLTVLAYHRIIPYERADFADYVPVVSATPSDFEHQMQYITAHFTVVPLDDLRLALTEDKPLPHKPLLITFDDGYLDNYEYAYPILKKMGLPAVIFLATSRMSDPSPLWWDAIARYFFHTDRIDVTLPLIGAQQLSPDGKRHILNYLLDELKKIPEEEKIAAVAQIREELAVTDPDQTPLFMNWDQVRDLVNNGIVCQAHTVTHPIMTRISAAEARRQLRESKAMIIDETGQSVFAFAYPNGGDTDYSVDTIAALRETGYDMAFTLAPGPMRWREAKAHPLQIRRVYLAYQDSFEVFEAKVMGLTAINTPIAYPNAFA